jgi:carbohydrate-selective porin OprB
VKRFDIHFLTLGAIFLFITSVLAQQSFADTSTEPPSQANLWERDKLTGDWGGARSRLEAAGVKLDLELTLFYQGLVSGSGSQSFEFGSRLDGFVKLNTGALGLWQGGGLTTHLEYRSGNLAGSLGGTFFPTNSGMEFPSESPDTLVATSLYLSQRIGSQTSFLVGKINALDLLGYSSVYECRLCGSSKRSGAACIHRCDYQRQVGLCVDVPLGL